MCRNSKGKQLPQSLPSRTPAFSLYPRIANLLYTWAIRVISAPLRGRIPGTMRFGILVLDFEGDPSRLNGDHNGKECAVGELK